ncbi:gamma-aminobutyric acid type B receptor subunit 1-like isoform X2 [Anneissia japonica]|uniref:gamma-aminobutyric acid type B receptor subunit 1-like isoform X2 n=1 Tax=Anneissia japonica TaxID=1529436 RepID=UPI00142555C5|nr:gamma-aminobutyric acid type B receptor subunit 1-like isoform X2 [Anneissia japonica]
MYIKSRSVVSCLYILIFSCLTYGTLSQNDTTKTPIYIAGFMPFPDPTYDHLVASVLTAIDHVNSFDKILHDYELRMIWNWTMADPGKSLLTFYEFINSPHTILMAWGPTYSIVGETLNVVVSQYNIVQVGIAQFQTDDLFMRDYPYTIQIYPNANIFNPARISLFNELGWKRASIIFQDVDLFRGEMEQLAEMMVAEGIDVISIEGFSDEPAYRIRNLKKHDSRIIVGIFYQDMAVKIFCEAYRQGLYPPKHVWMIVGWYHTNWWVEETEKIRETNHDFCTLQEMEIAVEGTLSMRGFEFQQNASRLDFNGERPSKDHEEYLEHLQRMLLTSGACDSYGYDQIITISLALNASIEDLKQLSPPKRLEDFTYESKYMADIIYKNAKNVKFNGLTGFVGFDEYGSRQSEAVVQQLQDGNITQVLVHNQLKDDIRFINAFKWSGGFVPVDGPTYEIIQLTISQSKKVFIYILSGLGIIYASILLVLNIKYRETRVMKLSSPLLNSLIVVGCIVLYVSMVLYLWSLEIRENSPVFVSCQLGLLTTCVGFSMAFGALFMKTYRVYSIFKATMTRLRAARGLHNSTLFSYIAAFVLIDVLINGFAYWFNLFEIVSHEVNEKNDTTNPHLELVYIEVSYECSSRYNSVLSSFLIAYKGAMLLFGVFLAWSTRNVKLVHLNDSHYIAICVYTVVICCMITVPAAVLHSNKLGLIFVLFGTTIFLTNTLVLSLVFLPKLHVLYKDGGKDVNLSTMPSEFTSKSTISKNECDVLEDLYLQKCLELKRLKCRLKAST